MFSLEGKHQLLALRYVPRCARCACALLTNVERYAGYCAYCNYAWLLKMWGAVAAEFWESELRQRHEAATAGLAACPSLRRMWQSPGAGGGT